MSHSLVNKYKSRLESEHINDQVYARTHTPYTHTHTHTHTQHNTKHTFPNTEVDQLSTSPVTQSWCPVKCEEVKEGAMFVFSVMTLRMNAPIFLFN